MVTSYKGYNLVAPVNNFNLSYSDIGEGDIPIIFLHGYPFDKSMWDSQLDFLRASHRVIACDIRGFGASRDEDSDLSIDLFADDLIQFMDKLSIDRAIICGLSMGGFIALNAHQRFPHRFEALILCDTQCIADTPEVKEKRYSTIDKIAEHGVADFNEEFIGNVFHKDSFSTKVELVEKIRRVVFANSPQVIKKGLIALAERSETCSMLSEVALPTLIICGREDTVTPLAQSEFMHETIEGSVLHVIDQAGHLSNLEHPHEFNDLLLTFLTDLSGVEVEIATQYQKSIE